MSDYPEDETDLTAEQMDAIMSDPKYDFLDGSSDDWLLGLTGRRYLESLDQPVDENGYTQLQRNAIKKYAKHTADEPCNCKNGIACIYVPFDKW